MCVLGIYTHRFVLAMFLPCSFATKTLQWYHTTVTVVWPLYKDVLKHTHTRSLTHIPLSLPPPPLSPYSHLPHLSPPSPLPILYISHSFTQTLSKKNILYANTQTCPPQLFPPAWQPCRSMSPSHTGGTLDEPVYTTHRYTIAVDYECHHNYYYVTAIIEWWQMHISLCVHTLETAVSQPGWPAKSSD